MRFQGSIEALMLTCLVHFTAFRAGFWIEGMNFEIVIAKMRFHAFCTSLTCYLCVKDPASTWLNAFKLYMKSISQDDLCRWSCNFILKHSFFKQNFLFSWVEIQISLLHNLCNIHVHFMHRVVVVGYQELTSHGLLWWCVWNRSVATYDSICSWGLPLRVLDPSCSPSKCLSTLVWITWFVCA